MLLRRRNTTSLVKFHPFTLRTSPDSWELTKHRTCEAIIVKNPYTEIKEEKAKFDFCWILFVMQNVSIDGNGIIFVI
jgi:hypothetical protein